MLKPLYIIMQSTQTQNWLMILNLLPVYQQTKVEKAGQKAFPLIVLFGVAIYAFLDVHAKESKAKRE